MPKENSQYLGRRHLIQTDSLNMKHHIITSGNARSKDLDQTAAEENVNAS